MKFLRTRRSLAGVGAVAAVTCLTLFVVLPAVASTPGHTVLPASSPGGITPTDLGIGGNGVCASIFPHLSSLQNVHEYNNPNPQSTSSRLPSGNSDNVTFALTLSGLNTKQRLQVTASSNAVMAAIGIKGGNDTAAYDYNGKDYSAGVAQRFVTTDGNLHAPASKFAVDSFGVENPTQWYGVSELNACYRLAAPISGKVFNDTNGTGATGQAGIDGAQVTIVDTTTHGQTTVTTSGGGQFSSNQAIGDSYTVCAALPSGYTIESVPTSGASCSGGLYGYSATLDPSGSSANNFGFQASTTISGSVYRDNNANAVDDTGDTALAWTVDLFKNGGSTAAQSLPSTGGTYSFRVPVNSSATYRVCVQAGTAPSGSQWAQSQPLPSSTNPDCASTDFGKGYDVTPSSTTPITGRDFGNALGLAGKCDTPFGSSSFQIQTAACKTGVGFVFGGSATSATLWTSVHTNPTPIVEKVTFDDPISGGVSTYTGLRYIDTLSTDPTTFPYDLSQATNLTYCNFDPRSGVDDFTLKSRYGDLTHAAEVLPGTNTSCAISILIQSPTDPTSGIGKLVAYVYTSADGAMGPH